LSRVYGTWQPITRVLGPNECVYWKNELQKYHTTKCNTHFRIFFYSQLVILGRLLLTWLTWFLPRLTLSIVVCQLTLLSFFWPLLLAPLWRTRGSGSSSPGRVKKFHFSISSRPALVSTQPPIKWLPGALSWG
jgi:hypothetical protein